VNFTENAQKCLSCIIEIQVRGQDTTPSAISECYYPEDASIRRKVSQGRGVGHKGGGAPMQMASYLGRLRKAGFVKAVRKNDRWVYIPTRQGKNALRRAIAHKAPREIRAACILSKIALKEVRGIPVKISNVYLFVEKDELLWLFLNGWVVLDGGTYRVSLRAFSQFPYLKEMIDECLLEEE
jgi:hypothetical protein